MKSFLRSFPILILLSLMLTGCWSRRELNELAIAAAIGIDKTGSQYEVSSQIVNPGEIAKQKGAGGRAPVVTYTTNGGTVLQALRRMTTESPRKIYLAHLRVIVIGEELAKEGIAEPLDFLVREQEVRGDFYVVIAKGGKTAKEIVSTFTTLEKIPANHLFTSLEMSERDWAATGKITLNELVSNIITEGRHPVLTGIEIRGNSEMGTSKENTQNAKTPAVLRYSGMAVFKHDKLIGWLNEQESKGYNYVQGNVRSTVVVYACPEGGGGTMSTEVVRTKKTVKSKMVNGKPVINVKIKGEGIVGESGCKIDMTKPETMSELERKTNEDIEGKIQQSIDVIKKKYKSDIFGFGEVVHRSYPKAWKELKNDWDDQLGRLEVKVDVDIKIRRLGTITQSIEQKIKE